MPMPLNINIGSFFGVNDNNSKRLQIEYNNNPIGDADSKNFIYWEIFVTVFASI
jgi:hypothetical protein